MIRFHLGWFTLFTICLLSKVSAQNSWHFNLHESPNCGKCWFQDLQKVEGGFIVLMAKQVDPPNDAQNWYLIHLIKYDFEGNYIWDKQYDLSDATPFGNNKGTRGERIASLPNGEWLVYGTLFLEQNDPFLAKFDSEGNLMAFQNYANSLKKFSEVKHRNGLYALGEVGEDHDELFKVDINSLEKEAVILPNLTWAKRFTADHEDLYLYAISDQGSGIHYYNWSGELLGLKNYSGWPIIADAPSRVLVIGSDTLWAINEWMNIVNYRFMESFTPFSNCTSYRGYKTLSDYSVLLYGSICSNLPDVVSPAYILQLDQNGEELFYKTLDIYTYPSNSILDVEEVHDGYVCIGRVISSSTDWMFKINKEGLLSTDESLTNERSFKVSPNPSTDAIQVQFPYVGDWRLVLVNSLGQELQTQTLLNTAIHLLDTSNFAAGTYILLARDQKGGLFSQKIQINRD